MVTSWVISALLVIAVKLIVGRPKLVPTKGQLIIESVIGAIRGIIEPIVGKKSSFPPFGCSVDFFFFILIQNWSGLLPGVGTVGYGYHAEDHFVIKKPLIRPGNADLNMTLA